MAFLIIKNEIITAWYSESIDSDNLSAGETLLEFKPEDVNLDSLLGRNVDEINDPIRLKEPLPIVQKARLRQQLKELYVNREFSETIDEDTTEIVAEFSRLLSKYQKIEVEQRAIFPTNGHK